MRLAAVTLSIPATAVNADITTDGTLGPRVQLSGPDMMIGAELGQTRGNNLFHSFQQFGIGANQSATFTGPNNIQNVIGRVTGGEVSEIDGALRSQVGQADVYLINPAGVVMGPDARIDVPASLHVSTADELRFSDGSHFSARTPDSSSLTMAAPEAFGFLGKQPPAQLTINGSELTVQPAAGIHLSAGNIALQGSTEQPVTLSAPGGTLRLEAVGAMATTVPVASPTGLDQAPMLTRQGQLTISQASLDTSGDGGGLISLQAGSARLANAGLIAENQGGTDATGGIGVNVNTTLELDEQSWLFADTTAPGRSGQIRIRAGDLFMRQSWITSDSYQSDGGPAADTIGDAGGIAIELSGALSMEHDALIKSDTDTAGAAGNISIRADSAWLEDGNGPDELTGILSRSFADSEGRAGDIRLDIVDRLNILNGAQIGAITLGSGDAGQVQISARTIRLDNGGMADQFTGILSQADENSRGQAGSLTVMTTGAMQILNGAEISSGTWSAGNAGSVQLSAGSLSLDGGGLDDQFTGVGSQANPGSTGQAGDLRIEVAGLVEILNGAVISSDTYGSGNAGTLIMSAETARFDAGGSSALTGISSDATSSSIGRAGNLLLSINGLLEVLNGATISSDTYASGDAGEVQISAGSIWLDATDASGQLTGIVSNAYEDSTGQAGAIRIDVEGLLDILNGAEIASSTFASGDAGSVQISAGSLRMDDGGVPGFTGISSQANSNSTGQAGDLRLQVAELLQISNGALITSDTYGVGDGGTVRISAGNVRLDNGALSDQFTGISSDANRDSSGHAGNLALEVTGLLEILNGAAISSSTRASGDAGTIAITAGTVRVEGRDPADEASRIGTNAYAGSSGQAGQVELHVAGRLDVLNGGLISTDTDAVGNAGALSISAGSLYLDDGGFAGHGTGITSYADSNSTGHAGNLWLDIDGTIDILNGARIATSTLSSGNAGTVTISADSIHLDGGDLADQLTGIVSNANGNSTGQAGNLQLNIGGALEIVRGAEVSSNTFASGDAGSVQISAGSIRMDDGGVPGQFTGIASQANSDSSGQAGSLTVQVKGPLEILNGAGISSSTFAAGDAGSVSVSAGSIRLDDGAVPDQFTGITTNAERGSSGDAGDLDIRVAGLLELFNGAGISSNTFSSGNAGTVQVSARTAYFDNFGATDQFTGVATEAMAESSGQAGKVQMEVAGLLSLLNGAQISSTTYGDGDAGGLGISAGNLRIDNNGNTGASTGLFSQAWYGSNGAAGTIQLAVSDHLELINGGMIASSTAGQGFAGGLDISAGSLRMDNGGFLGLVTGLYSQATVGSSGDAGNIRLQVDGLLDIHNGANISNTTFGSGSAAGIEISANAVFLDGGGADGWRTGILSEAQVGSLGNAGSVTLQVADLLELVNGAELSSTTFGEGNAGSVTVTAGSVRMDNGNLDNRVTGLFSQAVVGALGNAGAIFLDVSGRLEIRNGAFISSSTGSTGNAGSVDITANTVCLDGGGANGPRTGILSEAYGGSLGNAGSVTLQVENLLELINGAELSSTTFGQGNAGPVTVTAGAARMDNGNLDNRDTGLFSQTGVGALGDASTISLSVSGRLEMLNGAVISSSTWTTGNAGSVDVSASDVWLDYGGILSVAFGDATGQVGDVNILANTLTMHNDSLISILSAQTTLNAPDSAPNQHQISISAGQLSMNNSRIDAQTVGQVPAASIAIFSGAAQLANQSQITTQSQQADAGSINLTGGSLWLQDSRITTSAEGLLGNGGDITLTPRQLILQGGFIQANTAATGASGGDIVIGSEALIADQDQLEIGGAERLSFEPGSGLNLIQAAAPLGVQGEIAVSTPDLDITASLAPLRTPFQDQAAALDNPCQIAGLEQASSLVAIGSGGLPAAANEPASPLLQGRRLQELLEEYPR